MGDKYVMGVDYGTDSVCAIIVDAMNDNEIAFSESRFARWDEELYCDASINEFRQHLLDYIEGLEYVIKHSLKKAGEIVRDNINTISIDNIGATPVAADKSGTPLALLPGFQKDSDAKLVLWKDHPAVKEMTE